MKKILFTGASFQNKGSAAMIISTLGTFRKSIQDVEFVLASSYPKFDRERAKKYGLRVFKYQFRLRSILNPLMAMVSELVNTSVVVDLSGLGFSDQARKKGMLIKGLTIVICTLFRKPVILYSQSLGPFNHKFTRLLCKFCLQRASVIVVRGKSSADHLYGLGLRKNIYVYADSAFLLEPAPQSRLDEILEKEKIGKKESVRRIGIAVNTRIYERTKGRGTENQYVNVIAQLSDFLVENLDFDVVFVPYEITPRGYDDRFVARLIRKRASNKRRLHLIENEYDPTELKALTRLFDLFIGCRFHSIVASTSMRVPTIAVGWSHKYLEIMDLLGQAEYVCSLKDLSLKNLIDLTNSALHRRKEVEKELEARVSKVKASAIENARLVAKIIGNSEGVPWKPEL